MFKPGIALTNCMIRLGFDPRQLMKRASAFAAEIFKRYSLCAGYKLNAPCIIIDIVDSFLHENGKITYRNSRTFGVKVTRFYSLWRKFLFRVSLCLFRFRVSIYYGCDVGSTDVVSHQRETTNQESN